MSVDTFGDINYLAVLVAAIVYFALGGLWYAPPFLGRRWMEASGVTPEEGGGPAALYVLSFVTEFLAALALGFIATATGADGLGDGILLGLVVAVGFVVTTMGSTGAFEKRNATLQTINIGYHVVGLLLAAIIISVWT